MNQDVVVVGIGLLALVYTVWRFMPVGLKRKCTAALVKRLPGKYVSEEKAQRLSIKLNQVGSCGTCNTCQGCGSGAKKRDVVV